MMNIQVEVREKVNLFDEKRWRVVVACGDASQHLRWLAFASCLRVALDTGDVPAKFVPQVVKKMDGTMLDANKCIKDLLEDGSEVVIECSNGPKSLMLDLEERPADCVAGDSDCGVIGMDIRSGGACNILELVDWSVYGIKDITRAKSVFAPHVGLLQTLVIWYSCQGKELEDKDFGALNLAQFVQLFQEAMGADLSVNALEKVFNDLLMVNGAKGLYQVTLLEFLPAVLFVASGRCKPREMHSGEEKDLYYKKVLKDSRESLELCLRACQLGNTPDSPLKLPFRVLLPFLKKWHVLDKDWNPPLIALLVIDALEIYKGEANKWVEVPLDLKFGVYELQEFIVGAAYFCHKKTTSPIHISDKAYLQEFLKSLFAKACVAKPLYTTYDEKKDYLRSILISKDPRDTGKAMEH